MTFIPQAIADERSRCVLHVFRDEGVFNTFWRAKHPTVDAPGIAIHPWLIKRGDVIDLFVTGWNKAPVLSMGFTPDANHMPDFHQSGTFHFGTQHGTLNVACDGRHVKSQIYLFP